MYIYILLFISGLVFGSFYLVVATRLPEEESIISPGSHCDNCNHKLSWYELIPVISYIIQKGKCRKCGAKIPFLSVLIEIITGLSFCLSFYLFGFDYKCLASIILFSLTIIIFVSDFKYYIISDEPLITSILFILTFKYIYFGLKPFLYSLLSAAVMFLILLGIKIVADKAFKQESLGGGDVKLAILIGAVLGIKLGLTAFILSAFIALPYALIVEGVKKKSIVPYGPFIIIALDLVFVFMDKFNSLIDYLFMF